MNILLGKLCLKGFLHKRINFLHTSNHWHKLVQFKLSDIGEGIAEVQVKEWHVKVGDLVNEFDDLCAVQSDKASVTITSRYGGMIKKIYFQPDEIARVGQPLVDIEVPDQETNIDDSTAEEPSIEPVNNANPQNNARATHQNEKILASPAVRRLIREHQLSAVEIAGSGPNGRLLKEDVLKMVQQSEKEVVGTTDLPRPSVSSARGRSDPESSSSSSSSDDDEADLGEKVVPLRGYTRAMMKTMSEALSIPHFGYGDEIVANEMIKARQQLMPAAEKRGLRLSYMPFMIKATSLALSEFPILNSSLDNSKQSLLLKHSHNICLAMDTPEGLAVPNVKNCQRKSIWQIAEELNLLMECGKAMRFSKEQLSGGTFTISNIGSIGGTFMSPVILPPQVAIGAVGRIRKVPCLSEDGDADYEARSSRLAVQSVMNVFWAADHRVIDGATLARFSNRFKQLLENPALMLAKMR